jgi:hypothetical protein
MLVIDREAFEEAFGFAGGRGSAMGKEDLEDWLEEGGVEW